MAVFTLIFKRLNFCFLLLFITSFTFAHQSPTTNVLLDVSPKIVKMELELPLSELSLALGKNLTLNSETLVKKQGAALRAYLLAHTHLYTNKDQPWKIAIVEMYVANGTSEIGNFPYKELIVKLILTPNANENTREFTLDYDAILHQVEEHVAYVSIRNDWELGKLQDTQNTIGIITIDTKDNSVYPLHINLEKGSSLRGFTGMIIHGMSHIKEGTDHLLFILTLLLPACLLVRNKKWAEYSGLKHSLLKLLKIVTAFTIGHSITLLVGVFNLFELPIQMIEVLIAVSILISAIHAIKPLFYNREVFIAIGFGLIHGLAFSQTLQNLHLDTSKLILSVLGFNIGIELMQLAVILMVIPAIIVLSKMQHFFYIKNVLAALIIVISLGWILERITTNSNFITQITENIFSHSSYLIIGLYFIILPSYIIDYFRTE